MGLIFFVLFLVVPLLEIYGFITIGSYIGIWPTIGIVILTAIAGSILLRHQGMNALFQAQEKLQKGTLPVDQVIDGVCLGFAGALLLTPGFLTDFFGFLLFIPVFRRGFANFVYQKIIKPRTRVFTSMDYGETQHDPSQNKTDPFSQDNMKEGPIIDADYKNVDPASQNHTKPDIFDGSHSKNKDGKKSPWNSK